jgi:hypothetical protein
LAGQSRHTFLIARIATGADPSREEARILGFSQSLSPPGDHLPLNRLPSGPQLSMCRRRSWHNSRIFHYLQQGHSTSGRAGTLMVLPANSGSKGASVRVFRSSPSSPATTQVFGCRISSLRVASSATAKANYGEAGTLPSLPAVASKKLAIREAKRPLEVSMRPAGNSENYCPRLFISGPAGPTHAGARSSRKSRGLSVNRSACTSCRSW